MDQVKQRIKNLLDEGVEKEFISKNDAKAMDPKDVSVGKFYQMFKVHKKHTPPNTPPERPIISGSGSMTENIGKFTDYHLKPVANKHQSYLQDTPDFLRKLDEISDLVEDSDILVTVDVSALYTNIPQDEGLEAAREALEEREDKEVPTDFIINLLEIILKFNIFEFDNELYPQTQEADKSTFNSIRTNMIIMIVKSH